MEDATTKADMDNVKDDLAVLRSDLKDLMQAVADMGKKKVGKVRDKAMEEVEHRMDQLGSAYDAAKNEGAQAADYLKQSVEDHPFSTLAISFVAGLVIGQILTTRR